MVRDSSPLTGRFFTRYQLFHDLFPKLLQSTFCSLPWLAASFEPVQKDGQVLYRYRGGAYPPGGKRSRMRRCTTCGRTCPPNRIPASPCADCETQANQDEFLSRLRAWPGCELGVDLQRRWWSRRFTWAEFMANPMGYVVPGQDAEEPFASPTEAEEGCAFDISEWSDGPLASEHHPRKHSLADHRVALAIALRRLNPKKKEYGLRHPGCQVLLLPEERDGLKREISYFRRNGRIIPSARRHGHPYRPGRAPSIY